ncbi:MAG TPA: 3-oxoacyl-ACP reductase family protein [Geobacteraceae bacterium]|nr:3-oxoacyl-ACP reductase family protein [Geobacteraceae bacterium]
MEFKDKIVVVTGGTRGIGRTISLRFAREGARVFAAYLKNDDAAVALVAEAAGLAGTITPVKADVSSSEGAVALMEAAAGGTGHLDVLVNNAGIVRDCYLAMMSDADWDAVIKGNLYPLFHCCKWGARKMIGKRAGAIVNISSISALTGTTGQTNYAATKGGILSFTRSLARELGPMGIRVNAVAPGLIETELIATLKPAFVESIVKSSSLGRIGTGEEVAEAVLFLASMRASYITGQCLIVDGGIV